MGIPFAPVYGLVGSDLLRNRTDMQLIDNPFEPGKRILAVKALRPDVALFHGLQADEMGNVMMDGDTDDVMLAEAARTVIVTVEEVVPVLDEEASEGTILPGLLVDAVVAAPFGAHPAACPSRYPEDEDQLEWYTRQSAGDESFQEYLEETVFSVSDHDAYVQRFVPADWRGHLAMAAEG